MLNLFDEIMKLIEIAEMEYYYTIKYKALKQYTNRHFEIDAECQSYSWIFS